MRHVFVASAMLAGLLIQSRPAPGQAIVRRAQALADSGRFADAIGLYSALLGNSHNAQLEAATRYGRASALQRWGNADSSAQIDPQMTVNDYLEARRADSSRYFAAASNNLAILLRKMGDHRRALTLFLDASTTNHPARSYFFLEAGREYETLGRPDSASEAYRRALEVDPDNSEALDAQLALQSQSGDYASFVALAGQHLTGGANTEIINDALTRTMATASDSVADSCLVLLARNLALANTSPFHFMSDHVATLDSIAKQRPSLADPIGDLISAYYPLQGGRYENRLLSSWWQHTETRRMVWSTSLRALGDWYNRADREVSAQSMYEAALGFPESRLDQTWVDLDAALPLALIYLRQADSSKNKEELLGQVDHVTEALFVGKRAAYGTRDVERIRRFHITLGALFAEEKRWNDAIFQLERMRQMTERLRQESHIRVSDPPELLEKLVLAYRATNKVAEARAVSREVEQLYRAQGRTEDLTRFQRSADSPINQ